MEICQWAKRCPKTSKLFNTVKRQCQKAQDHAKTRHTNTNPCSRVVSSFGVLCVPMRLIHEIVGPHGFLMSACVMFATTFLLPYSRDPAFAKLPNFAIFCKILNFANFWRARSRLYQNEILQEDMRLTAFFKLYKICILLHRCNLKIFAKNRFEKSAIFVKIQQTFCKCCKICELLTKFQNLG